MPDLVIIDGGKGQVSAAKEVLDELGLHDLPLAGLAKEREELFLPGPADPIVLPPTSPALYLVQRLRDEAHRFAITYHRDLRAQGAASARRSTTCPASGPKRKRELLKVFGSIKRVRDAPVEQIAAVPGHRPVAGRPDQGDARGLTRAAVGSEFFIVRCTASLPAARTAPLNGPTRVALPEEPCPMYPARSRPRRRACASASRPTDSTASGAAAPAFRVTSRLDA